MLGAGKPCTDACKQTNLQSAGQGDGALSSEMLLPEFITLHPLGWIESHSQTSLAEQTQLPYLNKQVNLEA